MAAGARGSVLPQPQNARYYTNTMPHLEFYDLHDLIIHNWPLVRWSVVGIACFLFRRKPLTA